MSAILSPKACLSYYKQLQDACNDYCRDLKAKFRLDFSYYIKMSENDWERNEGIRYHLTDGGRLYVDTTAFASIDCANALILGHPCQLGTEIPGGYIDKCDGRISLWGLPQAGKSDTQVIATAIACTYREGIKGRGTNTVIHFTPNVTNVVGQFRMKQRALFSALGEMKVNSSKGKKGLSIKQWGDNSSQSLTRAMRTVMPKGRLKLGAQISHECTHPMPLVLPMSRTYEDLFLTAMKASKSIANSDFIISRDEAHIAVAEHSINHDMFDTTIEVDNDGESDTSQRDDLKDQTVYEMIRNERVPVQLIMCSATNWCNEQLPPHFIPPSPSYCGLNIRLEWPPTSGKFKSVAEEGSFKQMDTMSLSMLGELVGEPFLSALNGRWYANVKEFKGAVKREVALPTKSHKKYQEWCIATVSKVIEYLLHTNNYKKHRGMLMRFVCNNYITDELVSAIEPQMKKNGITLVQAYGYPFDDIRRLIDDQVEKDQKYVIFVTAKGRMSDSFPAECGYGIDLTWKTTYFATIIQSVLGRMMGHGKDSLAVLSDLNYERVQQSIANGGIPIGSVCNSMSVRRHAKYFTYHEDDHGDDPIFKSIVRDIQNEISNADIKPIFRQGKRKGSMITLGRAAREIDIWSLLTPYLDYLTENLPKMQSRYLEGDRFLTPYDTINGNDCDYEGRTYQTHENGHIVLSWRTDHNEKRGSRPASKTEKEEMPMIIRGRVRRSYIEVTGFDLYNRLIKPTTHSLNGGVPESVAGK